MISWSVYSHLKRIRRDDNIVSPLGLVWQNKIRANNKQRKCHTAFCEVGSNMSTMRKPRLPPARSLEITECEPRGQHSHRLLRHNPKASNNTAMWQKESWKLNTVKLSETWCETGSKEERSEKGGSPKNRQRSKRPNQNLAVLRPIVTKRSTANTEKASCSPESCHSVTLAKVLLFWKSCAIFRKKGHCSEFIFGAVNTVAFWTPRSGPPQYLSEL